MKNRLRELRKKHNLSQEKLAQLVNVSRQTIISIENGKYNPSLSLAFSLSKVFGCLIEEVFIMEEDKFG
ncbi:MULTISPECIES: helix-turn-helix transcriptional regulator [Thermoactinomyces]|jgi:putative transcriptional regulator|uniref:Helix-turn-helix transcriptional regulator n=1 Tax=Thermoactinomyces daqus TaxID=1329516 RepID=A0A7W1XBR0_9BACL|nr:MULTISPECIES: helix-turn-helix transcriptional regulator [Thermoactinomyces]MBA4543760.1 helix-turn-helix transcriptional regulator [Thermoactinomyces daqus]MBH8598383.1 helix-turn-helix transcriptional regulator [Thermoactinomyces sp. CICC 10523]MBH8604508.1 helix-turn-helix transcriptional regulator [Thermoactinomyces sp. CICC 10522]MBH8607489.1 helix-turn-helix transcriptional regulator [Thermoactinomyces sp. CICC 10521]